MTGKIGFVLTLVLVLVGMSAQGARVSNISDTKHNLSAGSGGVEAVPGETTEICVFCHTPHGANTASGGPLWNRSLGAGPYTMYSSSSMDAGSASLPNASISTPEGSSKLCLSCHDGTIAIGTVSNEPGQDAGNQMISMQNSTVGESMGTGGTMPPGTDGYTRRLGTDLTNDHPISINLDIEVAQQDGELRQPSNDARQEIIHNGQTLVGVKGADGLASRPKLPLEPTGNNDAGQVQCATCHDPHITETDANKHLGASIKFLRLNRFQLAEPSQLGAYSQENDIICLACHDKEGWETSAHALSAVADETYKAGATTTTDREFPDNLPVYKAACLNCHDTHTESGAPRLMREGANGNGAAVEETCYQCHSASGETIVDSNTGKVPNIKDEFAKSVRMPITTADQNTVNPVHDITDADFSETQAKLGSRHAECTDCHNPHRVVRNSRFNEDGTFDSAVGSGTGINDAQTEVGTTVTSSAQLRTHQTGINATSDGNNDGREGNVASGVLKGTWGIEPIASGPSDRFLNTNLGYRVVKGDPGDNATPAPTNDYLTREYQLCFKCHSNYAFGQTPPLLGATDGGTPPDNGCSPPGDPNNSVTAGPANCMTQYTNVMAEFASVNATIPATSGTDQGEVGATGSSCASFASGNGTEPANGICSTVGSFTADSNDANNHRSWHPVIFPTGRDRAQRGIDANTSNLNFKPPWADNIGTQTMQCSDCHGGETSYIQGRGANRDQVQGPHGSDNKFLLKTETSNLTALWEPGGIGQGTSLGGDYGMCGNCHQPRVSGSDGSGFGANRYQNHSPDSNMGREGCMMCHIAVPHGWKNKQFLINLLCIGSEAANGPDAKSSTGECVSAGGYGGDRSNYFVRTYTPYYVNARLRVTTWARSNTWQSSNCGGGNMEDGCPQSD